MMVQRNLVLKYFLVFLVFLLPLTDALAAQQPRALVAEGISAMERMDYRAALSKFSAAVKADFNDWEAVFFEGMAQNRLGNYDMALPTLQLAAKKGYTSPEMDFELGWAHMGLKSYMKARESFEKYEAASPGKGQTSEFIGRCQLALGRLEQAEASFNEALRRDPALKPTVELYLAGLEGRRKNKDAAEAHLREAMGTDSSVGRALRSEGLGVRRAETAPEKPFSFSLSILAGYNDNVIALGNTTPLPSDISRKDDLFTRGNLNLGYGVSGADSRVGAGYSLTADAYNGITTANTTDNYLFVDYQRLYNDNLSGAFRVSDEFTQVGGHNFRNQIGGRLALTRRVTQSSAAEAAYAHYESNYFAQTAVDSQNRGGGSDVVSLLYNFNMDGKPQGSLGYAHTWNRAKGADFDFQEDSFPVRIGYSLPGGINGEISYAYTMDNYDNPNSLTVDKPARRDNVNSFSLLLSKSFEKQSNVFVQYQGIHAGSNIAFYSFDQNVWFAGVSAAY